MTIRPTTGDVVNYLKRDVVFASEVDLCAALSLFLETGLDDPNLIVRQAGKVVPIPTGNCLGMQAGSVFVAGTQAVLLCRVANVVELRAKEEVRGIATQWGVAPVKNKESVRDVAIGQLPCDTMGA